MNESILFCDDQQLTCLSSPLYFRLLGAASILENAWHTVSAPIYIWMSGEVSGWVHGWSGGWVDEWTEGRQEGRMGR